MLDSDFYIYKAPKSVNNPARLTVFWIIICSAWFFESKVYSLYSKLFFNNWQIVDLNSPITLFHKYDNKDSYAIIICKIYSLTYPVKLFVSVSRVDNVCKCSVK